MVAVEDKIKKRKIEVMSTNTTDPYVPALSRHIFTAGGCSTGSHNQPQFNESNGAFTETWDGYIYVPESMDNVKLKVLADDNACFYLYAFPDNKANLPGRGPLGGGSYASAESEAITHLKKGYYRVNVTYENIDYPGTNVARLSVLLNGTQITIGQLETHNLITRQQAESLLGNYIPVNYSTMPTPDVWSYVGGGITLMLTMKRLGDSLRMAIIILMLIERMVIGSTAAPFVLA